MSNPFRNSLPPAPQGAGTAGAVGPARQETFATRVHDILHSNATFGPLFVLLLAVVFFSITADRFLAPANLSLIVQQVMVVGTLGIAQTLIILTAGIDLSVGAIMVLSSIVMAKLSADAGRARACSRCCSASASAPPAACSTARSSPGCGSRRSSSRSAR